MSIKERYTFEPTPVRAEYTVRPDVLRVSLTVSLETEESAKALSVLQRTCEQFQRRVREALGADLTMKPREARFGRATKGKLSLDEEERTITVESLLEVPLPAELDFWARGARLETLSRLCHEAQRDSHASKKLPRLSFSTIEARVLQPEAHRAELLRRFVTRARELAEAAGSPAAPLHVVDCTTPGAVEQTPISLEEVGLSLSISARLDVVRPAPAPLPG